MLLDIDFESDIPIYLQIRNGIVEGIAKKELAAGECLPSIRQFAEDLGVNMHTVNKAYSMLKDEGFIVIHKRKGVIVREEIQTAINMEKYCEDMKSSIMPIAAEASCKGVSKEEFLKLCNMVFDSFKS